MYMCGNNNDDSATRQKDNLLRLNGEKGDRYIYALGWIVIVPVPFYRLVANQ